MEGLPAPLPPFNDLDSVGFVSRRVPALHHFSVAALAQQFTQFVLVDHKGAIHASRRLQAARVCQFGAAFTSSAQGLLGDL